ncbi:hypothetical protein AAD046_03185 [Providencia rettgeri]
MRLLIVKLLCFSLQEILRVSCIILRDSYRGNGSGSGNGGNGGNGSQGGKGGRGGPDGGRDGHDGISISSM